jgi:hypothetical protein
VCWSGRDWFCASLDCSSGFSCGRDGAAPPAFPERNATISYQAYLTNIQAKTGQSPADFRTLAAKKGFTQNGKLAAGVKAGAIVKWLQEDFQLGHGHAMAIYALLKGTKHEDSP